MNTYSNKVILVGESGVGKTSIVERVVRDKYDPYKNSTVGAAFNFIKKEMVTTDDSGNLVKKSYNIGLWDTAGHERYDSILPLYYRCAKVIIVCFEYPNIDLIERFVSKSKEHRPDVTIFLCATKCDLDTELDYSNIQKWATKNGYMGIYHTSAKMNIGIDDLFNDIFQEILSVLDTPKENIIIQQKRCCYL